ncbi:MAG: threonine synthase [Chthoniobacterales bacterium]
MSRYRPPLHDRGVIARYREYLPITEKTPIVSINEGSTPLIYSPWLSEIAGAQREVYLKYEGLNPTGSFKDRGMTMAMTKALENGSSTVICASTGNTSAAAAAYAVRAGLKCAVLLPKGKIAAGKLMQAFMYGARVLAIRGNFDDALRLVREMGDLPGFAIVNSINPYRIEGQKTAAFEIIDELGDAPDIHILPVGNAGNITAYWKGYREFQVAGKATILPRMIGFQAAGSAPIFYNRVIEQPETVASAIRIGNPASWETAKAAITDSSGHIDIVTDAEIIAAQKRLAASDGVFVEPASAASVAGFLKTWASHKELGERSPFAGLSEKARFALTVTGHGLKDPNTPALGDAQPIETEADLSSIRKILES